LGTINQPHYFPSFIDRANPGLSNLQHKMAQMIGLFLLRECFLKTPWEPDATNFTEFHGKNRNKKAPFRGFRETRVQKKRLQELKKHSLSVPKELSGAVDYG